MSSEHWTTGKISRDGLNAMLASLCHRTGLAIEPSLNSYGKVEGREVCISELPAEALEDYE
jgi:hypothetical protein